MTKRTGIAPFKYKSVATAIQTLRKKRRLTQAQLADMCSMDRSAISKLEKPEHRSVTTDTLHAIANALGSNLLISFGTAEETPEPKKFVKRDIEHGECDASFIARGGDLEAEEKAYLLQGVEAVRHLMEVRRLANEEEDRYQAQRREWDKEDDGSEA